MLANRAHSKPLSETPKPETTESSKKLENGGSKNTVLGSKVETKPLEEPATAQSGPENQAGTQVDDGDPIQEETFPDVGEEPDDGEVGQENGRASPSRSSQHPAESGPDGQFGPQRTSSLRAVEDEQKTKGPDRPGTGQLADTMSTQPSQLQRRTLCRATDENLPTNPAAQSQLRPQPKRTNSRNESVASASARQETSTLAWANQKLQNQIQNQEEKIRCQEDILGQQEGHLRKQEENLRYQEGKLREQQTKMREQQDKIYEQAEKFRQQTERARQQESKLRHQDQKIRQQEEQLKHQEKQYAAQCGRSKELERAWKKATNELTRLKQQGVVHKVDDSTLKGLYDQLLYCCRNWASTYCGEVGFTRHLQDGDLASVSVLSSEYVRYVKSPRLRPILIQSLIMRTLWDKVLSTNGDAGPVWAGDLGPSLRAIEKYLEPGGCNAP